MTEQEEMLALASLAEDIVKVACHLAPGYGLDPVGAAMASGFAMTKLLFRASPSPELALEAAEIANRSNTRAMADMIAGQDTPHQVTQ